MSSTQLLISRRALLQVKSKHPKHFFPPKANAKSQVETPWPKWVQMAGYTAAIIAVPYTIGVVITQSRILIDQLEGEHDNNDNNSIGRQIVNTVRWYWGVEDEIPYVDYLERQKLKVRNNNGSNDTYGDEISLENEEKSLKRKNQIRIERSAHSDVIVNVETEGLITKEVLKGNIPLRDQLLSNERKYNASKGITVMFEDENDIQNDDDDETSQNTESSTDDNVKEIINMAAIYDMWHYFPPVPESVPMKPSSWMSPLEIRIEELHYKVAELQQLLRDPNCSRDRDEMEREIEELWKEIRMLRREKINSKLKKLVSIF